MPCGLLSFPCDCADFVSLKNFRQITDFIIYDRMQAGCNILIELYWRTNQL